MSQNKNDIVLYTKRGEIQIINENNETETKTERDNIAINNNKKNKKLIIISIIIGIIVVGFSVFCGIYFTGEEENGPGVPSILSNDTNGDIEPIFPKEKKLEYEFKFKTNKNDLRRINVYQKYYEDIIINNNLTKIFLYRNTIYDIYIISEEESKGDETKYYGKIYTAAISIVSECFSRENETCVPKKLVDLTNSENKENNSKEIDDLKNIPLPICLFNMTDNDVITSLTCHKLISEHKKRMMVLDLYFFRPPAMKRINKEESNITVSYINLDNNKKIIRETNGGTCDVINPFNSFCTTDMNTTVDSEYNILEYNEVAVMEIKNDDNNKYYKNKITKLIDETNKMTSYNYEKYEENLNKILPKLEPHFQTDILFSKNDYEEVYIASMEGVDKLREKLQNKRKLNQEKNIINKESNLFSHNSNNGVEINMGLLINPGLNTEYCEAIYNLLIENDKTNLITSKQYCKNINDIINQLVTLSEAGNHLATELLRKINNTLDSMTNEVNKYVTNLNDLVKFRDFSEIFDSTLNLDNLKVLPISIIQETKSLKNKLSQLLNEIKNGGIKKNIKVLNNDIYQYTIDSHDIIFELFDNLKKLSESLNSKKSKLTEISTYYLNNTPNSFIGTIQESEKILNNYFKLEYDLIKPQIDSLLKKFEDNLFGSLEKEIKIIDNLYKNIENKYFTIQRASDEDYNDLLNDLLFIKNSFNDFVNQIKEKISKEMEIKDSGYFISNYDITSNNYSFYDIVERALNIAYILDKDEYIDKVFDQIMINFRRNYTNIIKYMETKKEELFPLNEDVLRESLFSQREKNNIEKNISTLGVNILNKINNENEDYLGKIKKEIDKLSKNKEYLFNLSSDLYGLFSANLEEIANLYEKAFSSSLNKINKELNNNILLANNYFNTLEKIINNKTKIKELLRNYHTDDAHLKKVLNYDPPHYVSLHHFEDSITGVYIANGYLTKYESYKKNFAKNQEYIKNQLYKDLLSLYKKPLTQIKEVIQNFKNNKLNEKYFDIEELSFINDHIKNIETLYDKINIYISDNIFNTKYVGKIKDNQDKGILNIANANNNIENKNKKINARKLVNELNDFCVTFVRKKSYSCVSGVWFFYKDSDYYCFSSPDISNNHQKLVELNVNSDENLINFNNRFNTFYNSINLKEKSYTEKVNDFKNSISLIEKETIKENIISKEFSELENGINTLLNQKYGNVIIQNSYNYYQNNLEQIMGDLLNNITSEWNDAYDLLYEEIKNNLTKFKNSMNEFSSFSQIYNSLIVQNITRLYYDSIEAHQKSEFNYTIGYYYNILNKILQSTHQFIINKLPTNPNAFNDILDRRKNDVNNLFKSLFENIKTNENYALSYDKQINFLQVANTNFFKVNNILSDNILYTNNSLNEKISKIKKLRNNKVNDEISLTSRFYLENSISGKEIDDFYEQINKKVFVYLNLDKFKDLLIGNWIFDQDEFINKLNSTLYNSNLEIAKEFSTLKEDFSNTLESQITHYFTKQQLENRINELYISEVKELNDKQVESIKQKITQILNKIKEHLSNEAKRLNTSSDSYSKDYSQIQNRLNQYKTKIFNKLESKVFMIIDNFHQNMIDKVYTNYIEKYLNDYIEQSKIHTSSYQEVKLLNSSYKLGEILDNIILNYVNEYKSVAKLKIDSKYHDFYSKIKHRVKLDDLQKLINDEISTGYTKILYPSLKEIEQYNSGNTGYDNYDLKNEIINDIDSLINTKINEIEQIYISTKGNNYQVELDATKWKILDFSLIYEVLNKIKNSFDEFIFAQKKNEETNFNNAIQNLLKSNFNNLLNNIIPSFGNGFFERIINYNENFKISSLYNNLKFSLVETLSYYLNLYGSSRITSLTRDLKLKIFSLNNLDTTVANKNNEVLNLLEIEVDKFIIESKEFIINHYKTMINSDTSIELNFNELIYQKIQANINLIQKGIEEDYISVLNKYFKEQLITSYTNVMNFKTNDMIRTIKNQREMLESQLNDLFVIEPDNVLNDINIKMNNTLNLIEKYKNHFYKFKISNELVNFLNGYGESKIQPFYKSLLSLLDTETKDKIIINVEKNSQDYEKYYNLREFINNSNNIYLMFQTNYIEEIKEIINSYGINEYPDNLENEIMKRNERNRRLKERLLSEEEIELIYQEKIADKAIDDTFKNLLTSSNNTKNYINTFEKFDDFDKLITYYNNKIHLAYKSTKQKIIDNDYEEEILNALNNKLEFLNQMSLDYYKQINTSYYRVKNYLIESINEIYNELNECANITYSTFGEKYTSISKEVESFDKEESEISKEEIDNSYVVGNQNQITTVNYKIYNMTKKTKFKYDLEFEDVEIKKPRVKININNQNKPRKIKFDLIKEQNECGRIVEALEVEVNNVNYTMNVDFNTQSTDIILTTITNFGAYQYSKEVYQIVEESYPDCVSVIGVTTCFDNIYCDEDNRKIISPRQNINIEEKNNSMSTIIKN